MAEGNALAYRMQAEESVKEDDGEEEHGEKHGDNHRLIRIMVFQDKRKVYHF